MYFEMRRRGEPTKKRSSQRAGSTQACSLWSSPELHSDLTPVQMLRPHLPHLGVHGARARALLRHCCLAWISPLWPRPVFDSRDNQSARIRASLGLVYPVRLCRSESSPLGATSAASRSAVPGAELSSSAGWRSYEATLEILLAQAHMRPAVR